MKTSRILLLAAIFGLIALLLTSCFENEDAGPLQEQTKEYPVLDFDRLEAGDALNVTVAYVHRARCKVQSAMSNEQRFEVPFVAHCSLHVAHYARL